MSDARKVPLKKLNSQEKKELLESGPKEFIKKHGYDAKMGSNAIRGLYKKLQSKQTGKDQAVEEEPQLPVEEEPQLPVEEEPQLPVATGANYLKATIEANNDIPVFVSWLNEAIAKGATVEMVVKYRQ